MKTLLLKFDEAFFYKMKKDKLEREQKEDCAINWNDYFRLLFGISKQVKIKWNNK